MATTVSEETNLPNTSAPNAGKLLPPKIDRFLDVIVYSPDGDYVFLGASSLNTTLWKGSAWLFKDSYFNLAGCLQPTPANCLTGISVETGICSAVFLDNSKLLFGCDSGALRFNEMKINQSGGDAFKVQFDLLGYTNEHSSSVSDLDILEGGKTAVSCSQDCSIKVWDVSNLTVEYTYSPAHVNPVTAVKKQPYSSHTFASTSLDGTALFWDIRESKPARCIHKTPGVGLTAATWFDSDKVVLGSVSGEVAAIDIRKPTESCNKVNLVSRPVHRLEACPQDRSRIAVCQDSSIFSVIRYGDETGFLSLYEDDRHGDFVRCASWHPTKQYPLTCSWDSTILSHELPGTKVNGFKSDQ